MQKWMWALAIGAAATYFVQKTRPAYTWIVAGATAVITFYLWKRG